MNYPDTDNRLYEIIEEIQSIHNMPYKDILNAFMRQWKIDKLHAELDKMKYGGDRPPRTVSLVKNRI
jgi:hypothetical protein